jgi:hypothetical protein
MPKPTFADLPAEKRAAIIIVNGWRRTVLGLPAVRHELRLGGRPLLRLYGYSTPGSSCRWRRSCITAMLAPPPPGCAPGVPTISCLFFGDQPFWGRRVATLGAGPAPIPRSITFTNTLVIFPRVCEAYP